MLRFSLSLSGVFFLALILRLWGISEIGFTMDEFNDLARLQRGEVEELFAHSSALVIRAILYLLDMPGVSPLLAARLPGAVLGSVTCILVGLVTFGLTERKREAFLSALLLACCPFYISAARLYGTHGHLEQSFLVTSAFTGTLLALKSSSPISLLWSALGGIVSGIAIGIDFLSLPLLCAVIAAFLLYSYVAGRIVGIPIFLAGLIITLYVNHPTFISSPLVTFREFQDSYQWWQELRNFSFLGEISPTIPASFYPIVLVSKIPLTVTVIFFLGACALIFRRDYPLFRLAFGLIATSSFILETRSWRSPFYLTGYLPFISIVAAHGWERVLLTPHSLFARNILYAPLLIIAGSIATLFPLYPDYLLLGAQYSSKLISEFQGPAVSHGQWVQPSLDYIQKQSRGRRVWYPYDVASTLFEACGAEGGLMVMQYTPGTDPKQILLPGDWIVITWDALALRAPLNLTIPESNAPLVNFVATSGQAQLRTTLGPIAFPMVWIYEVANY